MQKKTPQDYANEMMQMYKTTANNNVEIISTENPNEQKDTPSTEVEVFSDGIGGLQVNVTTLSRLYPVSSAIVTVFSGTPQSMNVVDSDTTDQSGQSKVFKLETPIKQESQQPETDKTIPYANYNVSVRSDGYVEQIAMNVPVFSGVISVQGVDLVPISAAGGHTTPQIIQGGGEYNL